MVEVEKLSNGMLLEYTQKLVEQSISLWDLPKDCSVKLINQSENMTYLLESSGEFKAILRVHREDYHTERAIECELEWIDALASSNTVVVPGHYMGKNGKAIQTGIIKEISSTRFMVLFHFVHGSQPDESGNLLIPFEELGEIAARTHLHSIDWDKPDNFQRVVWDDDAVFGENKTWGDWRDAPEVDDKCLNVLNRVEKVVKDRLNYFGKSKNKFGLIHADMRLANLLVDKNGTKLIDFDDCGSGWFLYDFASAISFIEDDPRIPELKKAWIKGYRKIRELSVQDELEIETLIMLRRFALLAWIGSHMESPEAQSLAPGFAKVTTELGLSYFEKFS
jgi:Ser/Thr protein kinase RdoA (MazF antagonist)